MMIYPTGSASLDEFGGAIPLSGLSIPTLTTYYYNLLLSGAATITAPEGANPTALLYAQSPGAYVIEAAAYGVVADGKVCYDGVTVAGSTTFTSASAAFTSADVGKSILIDTPSDPIAGTIAHTAGSVILTGTGTDFIRDLMTVEGGGGAMYGTAGAGGCIAFFEGGGYSRYRVSFVWSGTRVDTTNPPTTTGSGKTLYRQLQLQTTITRVISATQVVLASPPLLSESGVKFYFATDDTAAVNAAIAAIGGRRGVELLFPAGIIGHSENFLFDETHDLTVAGAGRTATVFKDLRLATFEYSAGFASNQGGALSARNASGVVFRDMSLDGSVPICGMSRSSGGAPNSSGGRQGFWLHDCPNSTFLRLGTTGYGIRDECWFAQGANMESWYVYDCEGLTNDNGINLNGLGKAIISGCHIRTPVQPLLMISGPWTITNNIFEQVDGQVMGSASVVVGTSCFGTFANNIVTCVRNYSAAQGMFTVLDDGWGGVGILNISGNVFMDGVGAFEQATGAINFFNFGGSAVVSDNVFSTISCSSAGGKYIYVTGGVTKSIAITGNTFDSSVGSNMTIGIQGAGGCPAGAVTQSGNRFGPGVLTPAAGI